MNECVRSRIVSLANNESDIHQIHLCLKEIPIDNWFDPSTERGICIDFGTLLSSQGADAHHRLPISREVSGATSPLYQVRLTCQPPWFPGESVASRRGFGLLWGVALSGNRIKDNRRFGGAEEGVALREIPDQKVISWADLDPSPGECRSRSADRPASCAIAGKLRVISQLRGCFARRCHVFPHLDGAHLSLSQRHPPQRWTAYRAAAIATCRAAPRSAGRAVSPSETRSLLMYARPL